MSKVYVITAGEYSDYHICAVSLDPQKAETLKKFYDKAEYSETNIEEYNADYYYDRIISGYSMYFIQFERTGKVHYISGKNCPNEEIIYPTCDGYYINVNVWAKDEKSAIKIAAERRAMYLAEKAGIT